MQFFNSQTRKKEEFTYKNECINIYVCGPTVYDDAHLGHARSSISFDLLKRVIKANGFEVKLAKNYTDIDDKLIKKMNESGKSLTEISETYIKSYEADMKALNVLEPDISPRATEYINQMISFIEKLLELKYAYRLDDGIYLNTSLDKLYLSISNKPQDDTISRLENEVDKKNASDFVLWKFDENYYKASFGTGRPGWHTECVCMILDIFPKLHIHCGGADLLFPHHENEACQCRLATKNELATFWLHNGFVNINNEKMSKSLNNSFFVKDALKEFSGETLRFYLLSTHYRQDFNYTITDLKASKKRLDKIFRVKKKLNLNELDLKTIAPNSELKAKLVEALSDDLNTSKALAIVDEWVNYANTIKANDELKNEFLAIVELLGIGVINPNEYLQNCDEKFRIQILKLIDERNEAKKNKDYAKADSIRNELSNLGVSIQDSANGVDWEIL
ncbi:cysteine--tRNA ligase [Campylobacter sp. MG1]|uniref:cysteine--tRNA ligase n=1 Tax=Campylobacter sp. MG1 TaxID=2976332 RepID=UPI00226C9B9D|nr:cysteine--tRNA ligase [Campylobacter sp. MG1]